MKLKPLALMGICVVFAFASCKKDDDSKTGTQPVSSATIIGTWKITAQTVTAFGSTDDVLAQRDLCEKDDLLQFDAAHNMFVGSGATKCYPGEPDFVSQGTWALENNNTTFLMFQGDTIAAKVETLNATTFKFKITDIDNSDTIIVNTTLTKQ